VKNFLTVTMISVGVPMMLMGDEVRRTQRGNNNAYGHDNEINWLDWTLIARHADVHRFVQLLIAPRLLVDVEHEYRQLSLNQLLREAKISWHGVKLGLPDWSDRSHSLALSAEMRKERLLLHMMLNAYWDPLDFELPPVDGADPNSWRRWIDTAVDSPHDIVEWQAAPLVPGCTYRAEARSVVVLFTTLPMVGGRPR
jgi:isoamylase